VTKRRRKKAKPLAKLTRLQVEMKLKRALRDLGVERQANVALRELVENGDELRRVGEHWYELVEFWDPHRIQKVPFGDGGRPAYVMGSLGETIVVEVPKGAKPEEAEALSQMMRKQVPGASFLFFLEGVRFLKIATVSEALEAQLDAEEMEKLDAEEPTTAGSADDAGPGPESSGDGLGDRLPADVPNLGRGGDRDEAPDQAGDAAPDGL